MYSATDSSTRSFARNCPISADNTGNPPASAAVTPGVVSIKDRVTMNVNDASAAPTADQLGANQRASNSVPVRISYIPIATAEP